MGKKEEENQIFKRQKHEGRVWQINLNNMLEKNPNPPCILFIIYADTILKVSYFFKVQLLNRVFTEGELKMRYHMVFIKRNVGQGSY